MFGDFESLEYQSPFCTPILINECLCFPSDCHWCYCLPPEARRWGSGRHLQTTWCCCGFMALVERTDVLRKNRQIQVESIQTWLPFVPVHFFDSAISWLCASWLCSDGRLDPGWGSSRQFWLSVCATDSPSCTLLSILTHFMGRWERERAAFSPSTSSKSCRKRAHPAKPHHKLPNYHHWPAWCTLPAHYLWSEGLALSFFSFLWVAERWKWLSARWTRTDSELWCNHTFSHFSFNLSFSCILNIDIQQVTGTSRTIFSLVYINDLKLQIPTVFLCLHKAVLLRLALIGLILIQLW